MLTEENQVLILEPSIFSFRLEYCTDFFQLFVKTAKKVHEWYLVVKCENANKRTRFLSVKTFKNTFLETRALDLHEIDVTEHHFLNSSAQEPQGATLALRV